MQAIFFYLLKACAYSGILFLYYYIALRNNRFHYYNRFYLLMAVVLSLALSSLRIELWQWQSHNRQVVDLMNIMWMNDGEATVTNRHFTFSWDNFVLIICCFVTLCLLMALAFNIVKIFCFKRRYPVERLNTIDFINTDLEQAPFSFLNNLFWKNSLDVASNTGKQMFRHELTHIQQKHSWDKLFMRIITGVYWMNPFYWLIQKELSVIHEFIADEQAIEDKSAEAFALMLLQSQYGKSIFSPAQSFHYSSIKRRLLMLTTSKEPRFSYVRRVMILPLLATTVLLLAFKLKKDDSFIQNKNSVQQQLENIIADTTPVNRNLIIDTAGKKSPLYFIDGKETTTEKVNQLKPATIESVNVLKDDKAIKQYGEKGINGVVLIQLKKSPAVASQLQPQNKNNIPDIAINTYTKDSMLIVVNGNIVNASELHLMDPGNIESISVWKNGQVVKKYGEKGKNGVIEITTKEDKSGKRQTAYFIPPKIVKDTTEDVELADTIHKEAPEKVFNKTQVAPAFPGGKEGWLQYLQRNIKSEVPTQHAAPAGTYTVIVSFRVAEDGSVSNVKADNDPGYGTAAEAVRAIKEGPKWIPAKQNGHTVTATTKQAITFRVEEEH